MGHVEQGPATEGIVLTEATNYIRALIPSSTDHLARLEKLAVERHVPIIAPEVASLLSLLIRLTRPVHVLEVGTAMGYSATVMLMASESIETLYTIEKRYDRFQEARTLFEEGGFASRVRQLLGDAGELLQEWKTPLDMVFIDGAKGHYEAFFEAVTKMLRPGGLIVCDNVLFRGMVTGSEVVNRRDRTLVRRMDEFLHRLSEDQNYRLTLLPIHDGVAVIEKGTQYE